MFVRPFREGASAARSARGGEYLPDPDRMQGTID